MPHLAFASPRKLPKPRDLEGKVVVLDLAFASEAASGGYDKITKPFIDGLGSRLVAWVDHHDHTKHADFASDPRFVLSTKAEHGACPEMVTPEIVRRVGAVDTIVCHTDFDGLCSAAKWIRGGTEPYPGADDDARAIDTRTGVASATGQRFDRAIRARGRDLALLGLIVRHLAAGLTDASLWTPIDAAAAEFARAEEASRAVAQGYVRFDLSHLARSETLPPSATSVAFVDATKRHGEYDKTLLLLLGQERASIALLLDMDTLTLATRFDSGITFLPMLGLSGGMPTLVSVQKTRLPEVLKLLGVSNADASRIVA